MRVRGDDTSFIAPQPSSRSNQLSLTVLLTSCEVSSQPSSSVSGGQSRTQDEELDVLKLSVLYMC